MQCRMTIAALCAALSTVADAQTTWTVDDDGGGADFTNIADAIAAASDGDTIEVSPGVYTSSGSEVVNTLGKAITLIAVSGPEETVIDAQSARRGIVCAQGEQRSTAIIGFQIINGVAPPLAGGGGAYLFQSSPTLSGCWIINCTNYFGGAIYAEGGDPLIEGCVFEGNDATKGGAVFSRTATLDIRGCVFRMNSASFGGAVCSIENSGLLATHCLFEENTASQKGGAVIHFGGSAEYNGCEFRANQALIGGASSNREGVVADYSQCGFIQNRADAGGALSAYDSPVSVVEGRFEGNHATLGGAVRTYQGGCAFTACLFLLNSADQHGGAIHEIENARDLFEGCVFVGNTATGDGGALYADASNSTVTNCLFATNEAQRGGAIATAATDRGPSITDSRIIRNTALVEGGGMYRRQAADLGYSATVVCSNAPDQVIGRWRDEGGNCVSDDCSNCECVADFNSDGEVNTLDVLAFLNAWTAGDSSADINVDGTVNTLDVLAFLNAWVEGC